MLYRAEIFGVHDVGAMLVFIGGHVLSRSLWFFEQENLVHDRQLWFTWGRGILQHDVPFQCLYGFIDFIVPTTGVGAVPLVGIAMIHVT